MKRFAKIFGPFIKQLTGLFCSLRSKYSPHKTKKDTTRVSFRFMAEGVVRKLNSASPTLIELKFRGV